MVPFRSSNPHLQNPILDTKAPRSVVTWAKVPEKKLAVRFDKNLETKIRKGEKRLNNNHLKIQDYFRQVFWLSGTLA